MHGDRSLQLFACREIGRDRAMATTLMALLSALDRNALRNPDHFRSSTYPFASNLPRFCFHQRYRAFCKWYRPTIPARRPPLPQLCPIDRFLPFDFLLASSPFLHPSQRSNEGHVNSWLHTIAISFFRRQVLRLVTGFLSRKLNWIS